MLNFRASKSVLRSAQLGAFLLMSAFASHAQIVTDPSYVPTLTFDIASVRESGPISQGQLKVNVVNPVHASNLELTNFTVKSLLQLAYGFGTPISGGPDWMEGRYFNVQAKSDAAADEKMAKLTDAQARLEKQHMLQVLLADRLGLKTHTETKESSVYALVVAKNGPKMKELKADPADGEQAKPVSADTGVKATGTGQGLEFQVQSSNTRGIAAMLVSQLGEPVLDRTGLTGMYAFTLQFGRDWSARNPESWPDIFTAVQEQIGLKLDPIKAVVPVLIIDHIQLPSAN